jgi:outer membrane protein
VGAGLNYTYFFDEDTKGALNGLDFDLDNSFGWAVEGGVDFDITDKVFVGAQIYYIDIETRADLEGFQNFDVDINPWVYMLSVGTRF